MKRKSKVADYLSKKILVCLLIFISQTVQANDCPLLEKIVYSILSDRNVIEANKRYELSLVNYKYQYLQWWNPSVVLSNSLVYPHKREFFDDLATGNRSSLDFSFPLATGTALKLGGSYLLTRDLLETATLEKLDWGFTQDLEFSIGLSQSLNPWWFHSRQNPYSRNAAIQSSISKNDYNLAIKGMLFTAIEAYISLRKIERSITRLEATLVVYDELLSATQQLFDRGSVPWREYEKVRLEKWEYESSLFALKNDHASVQAELFRITGVKIENVSFETLVTPEDDLFIGIFMNIQKEAIDFLEQNSLYLTKESLQMSRLLNRQTNAPSLMIEWSTLYKLPISDKSSLRDVWKQDNFDNNIRNNWTLTISLDLSVLLSTINRMQTRQFNEEMRTVDKLLRTLVMEKQKERQQYEIQLNNVNEQIARLTVIIANDDVRIQENEVLRTRGAISSLEYDQAMLEYKEKQALLLNLKDDLWLYTFIISYY